MGVFIGLGHQPLFFVEVADAGQASVLGPVYNSRIYQCRASKDPGLGLIAKDLAGIAIFFREIPHNIFDLDFNFIAKLLGLLKKCIERTIAHPEEGSFRKRSSPSFVLSFTRHFYRYIYLERL